MICKICKTELCKDSYKEFETEDGNIEVKMVFKCPNKQCSAYGYKKAETETLTPTGQEIPPKE